MKRYLQWVNDTLEHCPVCDRSRTFHWYRERKRAKYFGDSAWRLCRFCGFSDYPSDPPWFGDRARLAWQGGMRYQRWNI